MEKDFALEQGERTPLVSVIIPHYQDIENLRECLDLLARQTLKADQFEIIVSDNMSPIGIDAVRSAIADRSRLVISSVKGAGPTRNAGAAAARGKALAFIDSDCRPEPQWLAEGLAALETHAVVGGTVHVLVRDRSRMSGAEAFEAVFAFDFRRYIEEKGFSGSGNLFVRREVWERVGGFRASVSEDVDWSWRAREAGFPVVFAERAAVWHPARETFAELKRKWRRLTEEGFLLMREQPYGRLRWLLRTWLVLLSPFPHALKVLRSRRLHSAADRARAIITLFAIRFFRFIEGHRVLFRQFKTR